MRTTLARYRDLMVSYLQPQWPAAAALAGLVCCDTALQLLGPQILRRFVDTAIAGGAANVLAGVAGLFVAAALVRQVVEVAAAYVAVRVGQTATDHLQVDLLVHCLRLDLHFHGRRLPGELIERVDGDVSALAGLFSRLFLHLAGNALVAVGVLVVLFVEDARLGAAFAAAAAVTLAVLHPLRGLATPYWRAERQASAELSGFLEERVSGAEDIRTCGAVPYVVRRLHAVAREQFRRARAAALAGRVMQQTTNGPLAAGSGLSAGEAQLLAFARVFLRDPGLVILDEASSRLDPATERLIGRAVERLLRDRTAIVIAHRLSTVRRADDVLVLEHGRVREQGSRASLAADPTSHFAGLLRTQFATVPFAA